MRNIPTKLTGTTTTIFTVMSSLAAEFKAINLSQGFPDYPVDPVLKNLVKEAIQNDHNQYAPMAGVPLLRQCIARKIFQTYEASIDPDTEITITTGASQAISSAITALIGFGEEVIVIEPAYDSYIPSVLVNGGVVRSYEMTAPDFKVDWQAVASLVNAKTRMLIINNPHNPSGTRFSKEDIDNIEKLVCTYDLLLLSDEVYEHLVYDGEEHHSILSRPALKDRAMVAFSFGKTFHATGWKVGYLVAQPDLTQEFRKVHQFTVFSVNTPVQHALAAYMENREPWKTLPAFFQEKRDLLQREMSETPFVALPSAGTYFQLYDYSAVSDLKETDFASWLTKEYGVATIPLSPFYRTGKDQKLLRICFAKKEETILAATDRLKKLSSR